MCTAADIRISSFYKFQPLPDYHALQAPLRARCEAAQVRGTILLAAEGINATIAGEHDAVEQILRFLRADPRLSDLTCKDSTHDSIPFQRLKVRLKREIVAMKNPDTKPSLQVGEYVEPADWNALITRDDTLLIDARNDYEVRMGRFPQALNPQTAAFHELPQALQAQLDPQQHKRLALYCTGGIRCEKATAFLLQQGYPQVYQLRGGILRYLEQVPPSESLWQGECFVFDERVSVDSALQKGKLRICDDCKRVAAPGTQACAHCGGHNFL